MILECALSNLVIKLKATVICLAVDVINGSAILYWDI
jgi:hypothetical protein